MVNMGPWLPGPSPGAGQGRLLAVLLETLGHSCEIAQRLLTGLGPITPCLQQERIFWKFSTHTAGGLTWGRQGEGGVGMCGLYLLDNKAISSMF